jgi:hypothetical protein
MIVVPSAKCFSTYNPRAEVAVFGTKKSGGTFGALSSAGAASNSGAFRVDWWDGTTTTYSAGTNLQYITKAIVAPYNTTAEKRFSITPVNSSGQQSGQLTSILFSASSRSPISFIDVKGLSKLESFNCDAGTDLTSYTHNGRIQGLSLTSSGLTSIDFPEGSLTYSVTFNYSNSLATINGLQNLKRLELFRSRGCAFTSLDFSNLSSLFHIDVFGCPLTSLRAQNCTLVSDSYSTYSYFIGGAFINQTNLDRTAIVQFFNDLGNANGYINVSASLGANFLTPVDIAIATGKGYTVLGGGI